MEGRLYKKSRKILAGPGCEDKSGYESQAARDVKR